MKPLNRPMFKYGGPIKEGIMNGMKEPVKRQAALVGDPVFPKAADGRAKHFLQIPMIVGAGLNALRAIPAGMRAARLFGATPGKLGFFGRAKDLATIRPGMGLPKGGGGKFPNLSEFAAKSAPGESAGFRIGSFIKQNPILSASIPSLSYDAARIGGPLAGEAIKGVANFLVPGKRFDPFGPKKEEVPEGNKTGIKRGDKNKVVATPETGGTGGDGEGAKQEINEDRINETKQRYYKFMGLDNMKKDAVYDSLIDASRIISEEGADLKGSIKSGTLQNKIIQAISGQLDKSAALKKQIDAAVLKGEIEKDIKANDPSNEIANQLRLLQAKKLKKDLEGSSAADVLATAEIQGKNLVTSNTLTSILSSKGTNVDFTFPDDKYQKWEKNNKTKDEIDYLTENYGGLDDGLYVVNKKAVQVKDGSATFVDLDKITG